MVQFDVVGNGIENKEEREWERFSMIWQIYGVL